MDTGRGPTIGWVVSKRVPAGREIILFDISGNEPPRITNWDGDVFCLSFGSNCVIDPVGVTEPFSERAVYAERPGIFSIEKAGMFLSAVDSRGHWNEVVAFNIETGGPRDDYNITGGIFPHWKIWESEAARVSGTAHPILDFTALPRV